MALPTSVLDGCEDSFFAANELRLKASSSVRSSSIIEILAHRTIGLLGHGSNGCRLSSRHSSLHRQYDNARGAAILRARSDTQGVRKHPDIMDRGRALRCLLCAGAVVPSVGILVGIHPPNALRSFGLPRIWSSMAMPGSLSSSEEVMVRASRWGGVRAGMEQLVVSGCAIARHWGTFHSLAYSLAVLTTNPAVSQTYIHTERASVAPDRRNPSHFGEMVGSEVDSGGRDG